MRNYVMLHKFCVQANKELLGAKHIKLHTIKSVTRYIKLWESKKEPKIYWAAYFINRRYVSNHIVILLLNIYLAHSRMFLFQFLGRITIIPPHSITWTWFYHLFLLQTNLRLILSLVCFCSDYSLNIIFSVILWLV